MIKSIKTTAKSSFVLMIIVAGLCFSAKIEKTDSGDCVEVQTEAQLSDLPIRKDIRYAISLGVYALNSTFNRNDDNKPWKFTATRLDGTGELLDGGNSGVSHNVGRCMWACMLAEEVVGVQFPPEGYDILNRYFVESFDNKDHLNSFIDPGRDNKKYVAAHNLREGLLGLLGMIKARNSAWALKTSEKMISTLNKVTTSDGHLSNDLAKKHLLEVIIEGIGGDTTTSGRLVGPLVEYYKITKNKMAMKLAERYAKAAMETTFQKTGYFKPLTGWEAHIHSICSTLSGVTLYAVETNDREMLEWCQRVIDNGVPMYSTSWGWVDELTPVHPVDEHLRGEINQTGDVVRTALLLGKAGSPEYYELAERFLRGTLLPAQHREAELKVFLRENKNPKSDQERDIVRRSIGGYGMFLPNDRMRAGDWPVSVLDITSGAVHALCECWQHRTIIDGVSVRVNLLFDFHSDEIDINSFLPFSGKIRFFTKSRKPLFIRIPNWVNRQTMHLEIQGSDRGRDFRIENGYLKVDGLKPGYVGTISFDIPFKQEKEVVEGVEYTVDWWGNQVIRICPRGDVSPLPF